MARDYRIIDADGHVLEPMDSWKRYIDPAHVDGAPRLFVDERNRQQLMIGGKEYRLAEGLGVVGSIDARTTGVQAEAYEDGRAGGFDPHARLKDMDSDEIDAAFLYPSIGLGFGGIGDAPLAAAICRAYNRWLADYCQADPERLFGVALLPMHTAELAIAELEFARNKLGFRAAMVHPSPAIDGRLPHHPDNDRLWAVAQDLDVAIAMHGGLRKLLPPFLSFDKFPGRAAQHLLHHTMGMMLGVTSMIWFGVCERFPRLRVGFMEAGGGWLPGWLDRMDRHFDDVGMNDSGLTRRPSETFQRQCWISFEPVESALGVLAEFIGPDRILWATDYPHPDGFFPGAPRMIRQVPGLAPATAEKILSAGARSFYRI
jgi:uncharacterized protein